MMGECARCPAAYRRLKVLLFGAIRMLPVIDPDCRSTVRQMLMTSLALIPASLLPSAAGMTGRLYAVGALALGIWFFRVNLRLAAESSRLRARAVLIASVLYLPILYSLLAIDRHQ